MNKFIAALVGLMLISGSVFAGISTTTTTLGIGNEEGNAVEVVFSLDVWTEVVIYAGVDGVDNAASDPIFTLYDSNGTAMSRESSWTFGPWADDVINYFGFEPNVSSAAIIAGLDAGKYTLRVFSLGTEGQVRILIADAWNDSIDIMNGRDVTQFEPVSRGGLDGVVGEPYVGQPGNPGDCIYYTNDGSDTVLIGPCGQDLNNPSPQPEPVDEEICYDTIPGLFGFPDTQVRVDCNAPPAPEPRPESEIYRDENGNCFKDIPGLFGLPDSTVGAQCPEDVVEPQPSTPTQDLPSGPGYSTNPDDVSGDNVCAFYSNGGGPVVYGPCTE